MDRRMALIGLGTALGPLLAAKWSSQAIAETAAGAFDYNTYRAKTLTISSISRQASDIAMRKAADKGVKRFAGLEYAEQLTLEQVMNGMQTPPLASLDAQNRADLAKLGALPAGAAFDKAYVAAEIAGHKALLALQDSLLQMHPTPNTDRAHIAFFMRTFIYEHLALLNDLQSELG